LNPGPKVVALVGSPRRTGNTVFAVGVATQELERRGVSNETILICDLPISLSASEAGQQTRTSAEEQLEAVLDRVWAADGLILATPIHFSNVSAQMKAFMDATNGRYMAEDWLTPKTVGLVAIGAHVFTSTIDAMRRYVDLIAPSHPPIVVATGHADAVGEAQRSEEIRTSALIMAGSMADVLLG
jgi:multimeric flavodoxin WrbA